MNKEKIREVDVSRAIMRLKLSPVTKLVLLGVLDRVDWSTFSGAVSSGAVATTLNHNRRSVVRALVELSELGYIIRTSQKVTSTKNTIAITRMNIELIMSIGASDNTSLGVVTPRHYTNENEIESSDNTSLGVVTPRHQPSDTMSLATSDTTSHIQDKNKYINYNSRSKKFDWSIKGS